MRLKFYIIYLLFLFNTVTAQWLPVNDIPEFINVPSFFVNEDTIYAGTENVIYISRDNGNNWFPSGVIHPDVDFISAVTAFNGKMFAGTYNYGVFESSDNGSSWYEINSGLNALGAKTISDFVIRDSKLYAATIGAGIYVKDLNTSGSWSQFNTGIPGNIAFNINSLIIKEQTIFAGAGGNGYYYINSSPSEGWTEKQFGEMTGQPLSFYDLANTSGGDYIVSSYGIYRSTDSGLTWNPYDLSNGLLSTGNFVQAGNEWYLNLTKSNKTVWYKSANDGSSWEYFTEVPGATTINTVVSNGKLYDGRLNGLWYYQLISTSVKDNGNKPSSFYLSSNYPNPFNPVTKINYELPENGMIHLKVFNITGEEIVTLVNEEKPAGKYEITFNAENLPNGVYIYTLYTHSQRFSGKMILLK